LNLFLLIFIFFALMFDKLNIFFYLILSSVCHEAGHILACIVCGHKPQVKASIFGLSLSNYPEEKTKKTFVLICGPLVNFIFIIMSCLFLMDKFGLNIYVFLCVNIVVFLVNMLPVSFLDGGQLVQNFVPDNRIIRMLDKLSVVIFAMSVFILTNNLIYSVLSVVLFCLYYYINKINLRL